MRQRQREDRRKKESRGTKLWEIDKKESVKKQRKKNRSRERKDR
jgi:hypothetical protein